MVDAIAAGNKPIFTTIKYTTKDGENVTVTKKDGVVTLVGDKNGVRQMPLEDFIKKELPENIANIKLENNPPTDTVEISSKPTVATGISANNKSEISGADIEGKNLDVAA